MRNIMIKLSKPAALLAAAVFFVCLFVPGAIARRPEREITHGILLQGFGWNVKEWIPGRWYAVLESKAKDMADLGVNMVWFPPVSRSVSAQGYLPGDYYDLGTIYRPTFYGDQHQLESALKKLRSVNIGPIADIVINHRCASQQDEHGNWNIYHYPSGEAVWEQWAVCSGQFGGTGSGDSGTSYHAAPDVDHTNSVVQRDIIKWLKWMKDQGFVGWRYDFSKGYDAKYTKLYNKKSRPVFSVGEVWTNMHYDGSNLNPDQNAHRQGLCDWLDKAGSTACVFDFTTKGILQTAVQGEYWRLRDSEGKASGLIGWWPKRAVTFVDNHDTGSQQSHWPFPGDKVMQGYAYILTHPGIPCVFWEHVYDWNLRHPIKKLITIRKKYGIHNGSTLKIVKAEHGLYAAIIDDRVALKLGWVDWEPGEGFEFLESGDKYAVWGKKAD